MDYPKEQLWELYKSIPKDLQEAVFSEKVADIIYNACSGNNIKDETKIREVAKHIGYVLMGIIPPVEFPEILEKEVKLKKIQAQKISQEINDSVFLPVKNSLEKLYNIKIEGEEPKLIATETQKQPSKKKDRYREPLE